MGSDLDSTITTCRVNCEAYTQAVLVKHLVLRHQPLRPPMPGSRLLLPVSAVMRRSPLVSPSLRARAPLSSPAWQALPWHRCWLGRWRQSALPGAPLCAAGVAVRSPHARPHPASPGPDPPEGVKGRA